MENIYYAPFGAMDYGAIIEFDGNFIENFSNTNGIAEFNYMKHHYVLANGRWGYNRSAPLDAILWTLREEENALKQKITAIKNRMIMTILEENKKD